MVPLPSVPAVRFEPHLADLLARAAVADHRIGRADAGARSTLAQAARRERARATVRLDASPLMDATADAVDAGEGPRRPQAPADAVAPPHRAGRTDAGGWARALQLQGMPTEEVAALEYSNALAGDALAEDLAEVVFSRPREVLTVLHAEVCRGLVEPEVVGRLRRTSQAVHDGAQGLMVYSAPEPEAVPDGFDALLAWLREGSAMLPALLAAGTAELRMLELCPFEAANGRTARLLARVVSVARGFDRHGLGVPERAALADPLAYYREVAASIRRRGDVTGWVERHAEAVVLTLEEAAAALDPLPAPPVSATAVAAPAATDVRDGDTLVDLARRTGVSLGEARVLVDSLLASGAVEQMPGSHGLRLIRR